MEIEQLPPKKPNFLLVVALSAVALVVLFILAYLFVDFDGRHLTFRHHQRAPHLAARPPHLPDAHSPRHPPPDTCPLA